MIFKSRQQSKGFTPTPTLALFRFLKILPAKSISFVRVSPFMKNIGETKKPRQSWCRGFTLLETMVAVTILLIAVVGPISIIGDALHKIYFARDQMIAINLAQEGIEVIRQKRDTNFLDGSDWDSGFGAGACTGGLKCLVDVNPSLVIHRCNGSCTDTDLLVYQDPTDGSYHQYLTVPVGPTPTVFTRRVDTTQTVPGNEYKVEVTVTWKTGNILGSITVSESIFRWAKA